MALPPWITSRQSSRRLRGPSRPSSWAPWPSGQRTIPARTSATTPSPNRSSSSAQAAASPRLTRPTDAAVYAADRPSAIARPPGSGWAAGSGACRNRNPKAARSRSAIAGNTIARARNPRPKVVAEAGQGALHRPGRAANVWERLGWPQLGRPAIPPRPAATPPPTRWAHRRPPPHRVAHGLPLPGHRQHKRRPTHRIRNDLIDQIIAATRRSKYATVVGAEPGRPAGSSSLAGAEHAGPGGWSERPGGSRPAV
jgi:hypothetical protein